MLRTFTEIIVPTPTEIADTFWDMEEADQIATLHAIYTRFFSTPENGLMQLAAMSKILDTKSAEYQAGVKKFVAELHEYLVEEEHD